MGKRNINEVKQEKRKRKRLKKEKKEREKNGGRITEHRVEFPKTKSVAISAGRKRLTATATGKSILSKRNLRLVVSLLPSTLGRNQEFVEDSIRLLLLKHSESVGGIMLAYDNVTIEAGDDGKGRGWILNELPYIHYNVSCDALVFRPTVGCKVCSSVKSCNVSPRRYTNMLSLHY